MTMWRVFASTISLPPLPTAATLQHFSSPPTPSTPASPATTRNDSIEEEKRKFIQMERNC